MLLLHNAVLLTPPTYLALGALFGRAGQTFDPKPADCDGSKKMIGAIKNAPESAWKPLIRILSGYHQTPIWRQLMATTTNAVDRAARLIVGPDNI
jgi:hypothetical protein